MTGNTELSRNLSCPPASGLDSQSIAANVCPNGAAQHCLNVFRPASGEPVRLDSRIDSRNVAGNVPTGLTGSLWTRFPIDCRQRCPNGAATLPQRFSDRLPGTRAYLLGLKDGFGRPYYTPDPSSDSPFSKLLGYDIVLNQSMPSPTAGAFSANQLPILFGDLERSYMLRTDGQPSILRLNERYAVQATGCLRP